MILEDVEYVGVLPDIPSESKGGIDLRYADKSVRVVKCRVKCLHGQVCLFLDTEYENVATACLVLDEVKKENDTLLTVPSIKEIEEKVKGKSR